MAGTRSDIKLLFNDISNLTPAKFSRLIDALWRDYLVLYAENKLCYLDLHLLDPTDPDYDERYRYTRNKFTNPAGELLHSWGTTQGYGHSILSDFAQVFGFFNYALSQFETVMGPYALPVNQNIDPQQPKTWRNTDRLFTLGNGKNESTRSNALVIFKSGLVQWHNAQIFGAYSHQNDGETPPPLVPGILQYTALDGFTYSGEDLNWHSFAKASDLHNPVSLAEGHAEELTLSDQVLNLDLSAYAKTSEQPIINFAIKTLTVGNNTITFSKAFTTTAYTLTYNAYISATENTKVYVITKNKATVIVRAPYACTIEYQAIGN